MAKEQRPSAQCTQPKKNTDGQTVKALDTKPQKP